MWIHLTSTLNSQKLNEVVAIPYFIWQRRNDFVHKNKFVHPSVLVAQAPSELYLSRQQVLHNYVLNCNVPHPGLTNRWQKPHPHMYKVNWKAALSYARGRTGIGVLIRNHEGLFVGALRASRPLVQTTFIAKSMALLLADQL